MINYQAPNPYQSRHFIASILRWLVSPSSRSVGKLVLPAQSREPELAAPVQLEQLALNFSLYFDAGFVTTHDNATLDTLQFSPQRQAASVTDQYFIIKFNGNGMQYNDALDQYAMDADSLNSNVIAFNYRGVGQSEDTPANFQDLVTDGIAQVQRLLDLGADSKKITLDGLSLGGGVATMVAAHFHKLGLPVYLWNDRSFASLSKTVAGMLAPNLVVEKSLEVSSSSLMSSLGWDVDVASAYKAIPSQYKGYMVVGKPSAKSLGDGVIPPNASLHKSVKQDKRNATGYKVYATLGIFGGGHNMPRNALISKSNPELTGQDLFEEFVRNSRV